MPAVAVGVYIPRRLQNRLVDSLVAEGAYAADFDVCFREKLLGVDQDGVHVAEAVERLVAGDHGPVAGDDARRLGKRQVDAQLAHHRGAHAARGGEGRQRRESVVREQERRHAQDQ